jgi:hypothetical protein
MAPCTVFGFDIFLIYHILVFATCPFRERAALARPHDTVTCRNKSIFHFSLSSFRLSPGLVEKRSAAKKVAFFLPPETPIAEVVNRKPLRNVSNFKKIFKMVHQCSGNKSIHILRPQITTEGLCDFAWPESFPYCSRLKCLYHSLRP